MTDPLVVVVGSHEPRKNHLAVLEAAERLWTGGATFELLFIGGSGWKGEEFDALVASLVSAGRPIIVRKRCTEEELWTAYSLARFTVFPSLLEGFGLPVAESLACGTPAITSAHGSMAEIAEGGGCLVVDPRDVDALESAMSRLLRDDRLLERLRLEAASRPTLTWDDYASELGAFSWTLSRRDGRRARATTLASAPSTNPRNEEAAGVEAGLLETHNRDSVGELHGSDRAGRTRRGGQNASGAASDPEP